MGLFLNAAKGQCIKRESVKKRENEALSDEIPIASRII